MASCGDSALGRRPASVSVVESPGRSDCDWWRPSDDLGTPLGRRQSVTGRVKVVHVVCALSYLFDLADRHTHTQTHTHTHRHTHRHRHTHTHTQTHTHISIALSLSLSLSLTGTCHLTSFFFALLVLRFSDLVNSSAANSDYKPQSSRELPAPATQVRSVNATFERSLETHTHRRFVVAK